MTLFMINGLIGTFMLMTFVMELIRMSLVILFGRHMRMW